MTIAEFIEARIAEKLYVASNDVQRVEEYLQSERECEAMRRILKLHGPHAGWCSWTIDASDTHSDFPDDPCDNLRALATIWSNHADYDEAWRI